VRHSPLDTGCALGGVAEEVVGSVVGRVVVADVMVGAGVIAGGVVVGRVRSRTGRMPPVVLGAGGGDVVGAGG